MHFDDLNLIPPLLSAVRDMGYDQPTPIQRETIPPVLAGRDVLGCAQTGTGKTAAFALPILQRLSQERKQHAGRRTIRALILTPTRELALQIFENFESYGKNLPLTSCVIFGGVGQQPQVEALSRGVDILVATPGRLNDLIGQGHITLEHIEIFVLDEADRMLDMGFIHDVRKVIALLPRKRQTLLFSATIPKEIEESAEIDGCNKFRNFFAIILPALGSAILFNLESSTGGTDILAMILKKYSSLDIGKALLCVDVLIAAATFLVFDAETGLCSMLGLTLRSVLVDTVIESLNRRKNFILVTSLPEEVCGYITHTLHRSATCWEAEGAYSHEKRWVVMAALSRIQAVALRQVAAILSDAKIVWKELRTD